MKAVYLAAGASSMLCGSCMRDNRLAATLIEQGRDIALVPLYTPLRTDEPAVASSRVYYGGLNVFLEQKSRLFRMLPRGLTRVLDAPALLRGVGRLAAKTRPEDLGALTVSVLRGEHGLQRREIDALIDGLRTLRPSLINLPDLMFVGIAGRLRGALDVPIVCTLSGEDLFLDGLPQPYRDDAIGLIRGASGDVDCYIAVTRYYRDHCIRHFGLPPDRLAYVPMGIRVGDAVVAAPPPGPFNIAYLARVCPEKGLMNLAKAFAMLRREGRNVRLLAAGYLGPADQAYLEAVRDFLLAEGCENAFEYSGELDRAAKFEFLARAHVLSVPTNYHEAKGLFVLEALAAGVPVVQPQHGSFPELIADTGGGLLYDPADPAALAAALARLIDDPALRRNLADRGRDAVFASHSDREMADRTWAIYEDLVARSTNRV